MEVGEEANHPSRTEEMSGDMASMTSPNFFLLRNSTASTVVENLLLYSGPMVQPRVF